MATQMVFVPLRPRDARRLRDAGTFGQEVVGHAATPALLRAHSYDSSTLEDAEYAALTYAGLRAALEAASGTELRLVLAAELAPAGVQADPEDAYGRVVVSDLRWPAVRALFADEPVAAAALAAARAAAAGHTLAVALALPEVEMLTQEHDLLWFAPDELDHLPSLPSPEESAALPP